MLKKQTFTLLIDKRPQGAPSVFALDIGAGASALDAVRIAHAMCSLYGAENVTLMNNTIETVPVELAFKAEGATA